MSLKRRVQCEVETKYEKTFLKAGNLTIVASSLLCPNIDGAPHRALL